MTEMLETHLLRSGSERECLLSPLLSEIVLEVLANAIRKKNQKTDISVIPPHLYQQRILLFALTPKRQQQQENKTKTSFIILVVFLWLMGRLGIFSCLLAMVRVRVEIFTCSNN